MTNNQVVLSSLAMDLKRVALGYHRGSLVMARRFLEEALKRSNEVDRTKTKRYLIKLLNGLGKLPKENRQKAAEDALMLSTLFQNAALH